MARETDRALRESNLKLRLALRAAQIGIWDWSLETDDMQYSARARAICGFPAGGPVTYAMVREATHPEDRERTSGMAREALDPALRKRLPYEYRVVRADTGEVRWVVAHGEALFATVGGAQKAVRYIGTIQDISERKVSEQFMADGELRQRLAIDAARLAVWEIDLATDSIRLSPELNRLFGLSADAKPTLEALRRAYLPGERERVQEEGRQALASGNTRLESEFRIRWPDGSVHWLMMRAEVVAGPSGGPGRVVGVIADIDSRKKHEEQQMLLLRELNHRVKNTLSVVQSLATQTFRQGKAEEGALVTFRERLHALSQANDLLIRQEWRTFGLRELVERMVAPYRGHSGRISIEGDEVSLPPRMNVPLALVLHELCTNAAKYGSLAEEAGRIEIKWTAVPGGIDLVWSESGGRAVETPLERGFGTRLISEILAVELGSVEFDPRAEGVRCRLRLSF